MTNLSIKGLSSVTPTPIDNCFFCRTINYNKTRNLTSIRKWFVKLDIEEILGHEKKIAPTNLVAKTEMIVATGGLLVLLILE